MGYPLKMNVCSNLRPQIARAAMLAVFVGVAGCGSTLKREATEQLLTSDAVDRAVEQIDFRDLAGEKVYFDTQYIRNIKGVGFVNAEYIISSLRQQLAAADCLMQDKLEDADFVVEARIGALGADGHEVTYGLPANNLLNAASSFVPTVPTLPSIPEISIAKKNHQLAAAKLGVFAYDRRTRHPIWQAGIAQARSTAKDTWILGAGPFQRGTIYSGTQFAGSKLRLPALTDEEQAPQNLVAYDKEHHFRRPRPADSQHAPPAEETRVRPAHHEEPSEHVHQAASPPSEPPRDRSGAEDQIDEKKDNPDAEPEWVSGSKTDGK